ncbi:P-II family nitrogen regulator [Chthonobacter rhizosphaerae]|uniref:P-II family nitrogen regulator n=1 Tax=Chthonobacter rhizosphaerae TaxID=2735553 RepID=UPI0015EEB7D9|nr:transcriptional regulator [Chthonobacter rhizosphaerae]
MQMHPKKRIEIIVEAPVLHRLTDLLDRLDATGYTVVPVLGGRGRGGSWTREGLATDAGRMVMVVVVTGEERLDAILQPVFSLVTRQIGIVTVSDVMVMRAEHF